LNVGELNLSYEVLKVGDVRGVAPGAEFVNWLASRKRYARDASTDDPTFDR